MISLSRCLLPTVGISTSYSLCLSPLPLLFCVKQQGEPHWSQAFSLIYTVLWEARICKGTGKGFIGRGEREACHSGQHTEHSLIVQIPPNRSDSTENDVTISIVHCKLPYSSVSPASWLTGLLDTKHGKVRNLLWCCTYWSTGISSNLSWNQSNKWHILRYIRIYPTKTAIQTHRTIAAIWGIRTTVSLDYHIRSKLNYALEVCYLSLVWHAVFQISQLWRHKWELVLQQLHLVLIDFQYINRHYYWVKRR